MLLFSYDNVTDNAVTTSSPLWVPENHLTGLPPREQLGGLPIAGPPINGPPFGGPQMDASTGVSTVRKIRIALSVILMVLGGTGNILTILVMRREKFKSQSLCVMFIALALADTFWLTYMPTLELYELIVGSELHALNSAACKITYYLIWVNNSLGNWLLMGITIERTIAILIPHKYRIICTKSNEIIILVALLIACLVYNCHGLFTFELQKRGPVAVICFAAPKHQWFYLNGAKNIMNLALVNVIPFAVILIGNILIIVSVVRSNNNLNKTKSAGSQNRREKQANRMVGMLCSISAAFICLTLPIMVHLALPKTPIEMKAALSYDNPVYLVVHVLKTLHHAINFILYICSGEVFRNELLIMLGVRSKPQTASFRIATAARAAAAVHASKHGVSAEDLIKGGPCESITDVSKENDSLPSTSKSSFDRESTN